MTERVLPVLESITKSIAGEGVSLAGRVSVSSFKLTLLSLLAALPLRVAVGAAAPEPTFIDDGRHPYTHARPRMSSALCTCMYGKLSNHVAAASAILGRLLEPLLARVYLCFIFSFVLFVVP